MERAALSKAGKEFLIRVVVHTSRCTQCHASISLSNFVKGSTCSLYGTSGPNKDKESKCHWMRWEK